MRTQIANLFVALVATLSFAATSNAQTLELPATPQIEQIPGQELMPQVVDQGQQLLSQPQALTLLPPGPQISNPFYFGMRVELVRNWGGASLRVVGVDYGSPAQMAGLEFGDEIRTINGRGFGMARDSYDAVRIMNQAMAISGGVPMGPAPAISVWPGPRPSPVGRLVVRNVRNGQNVGVTIRPMRRDNVGAPAAAAPVVAGG